MISVLLVVAALVVAMLWVAVRRGLQMKQLAIDGVGVQGRVDKLWRHTGPTDTKSHRLRYRFETPDGRSYERSVVVAAGERQALKEGVEVALVYLPTNPKVSALAAVVAQARQALARR